MANTQWVKVDSSQPQKSDNGGAFFAGVGITTLVALGIHNAGTSDHQKQIQEAYSRGFWTAREQDNTSLAAKDAEIARLAALLRTKDVDIGKKNDLIDHLVATNENLTAIVKAHEIQMMAKIFPHDDDKN